jgi:hypothetical protein
MVLVVDQIFYICILPSRIPIFLYIIILIIILLIIRVIKANFEICEWQRGTGSGAEHCQWRFCYSAHQWQWRLSKRATVNGVFVNATVDPTVVDRDEDEQEQTRHWQWCVYTVLYKNATGSGALPFVDFKFYFYHSYY